MKNKNNSVLTTIMVLALCFVVLAGCGSTATPPVGSASPTADASPTATPKAKAATPAASDAKKPDATTSATYDGEKTDATTSATKDGKKANTATQAGTIPATDIGTEEAKNIALEHAGLTAGDVTFIRAEQDYDYNRVVYEVEFFSPSKKYDYEIDASTGEILSHGYDLGNYTNTTVDAFSNTDYIGVEEAKAIALEHAGLTASEVTFSKDKLDKDDGHMEYEIEFIYNGTEYEYKIDASNGNIIEYDSERHH